MRTTIPVKVTRGMSIGEDELLVSFDVSSDEAEYDELQEDTTLKIGHSPSIGSQNC